MPGATADLALPYPLDGDPNDVPGDLAALAERVDLFGRGVKARTTVERDAIAAGDRPPGRLIFNSTTGRFEFWTGAAWAPLPFLGLAGGTLAGAVAFADNELAGPHVRDYSEAYVDEGNMAAGLHTWDYSAAQVRRGVLNGAAITTAISNPPASGRAGSLTFILYVAVAAAVSWPANTLWPDGTPPAIAVGRTVLVTFTTVDGGATWLATWASLAA